METAQRPLMFSQLENEARLTHSRVPWITYRPPPQPGHYLVSILIDDDSTPHRSVRMERWDGERWSTLGGYCKPEGWWWVPEPVGVP